MQVVQQGDDCPGLKEIFASLDDHLAVAAVLEGAVPGTIWTDNPKNPHAALMRVHHRFYLAGEPNLPIVNADLHHIFTGHILPEGLAAGEEAFSLYYSDGWERVIADEILRGVEPIYGVREYWEHTPVDECLAPVFQEDFELVEVNRALVEDPALTNLDDLLEEMQSERESVATFLQSSFGLCLRTTDRIVTWCLSEYNLRERCEVGIATGSGFRGRGLASATGAAFVRLARSRGMARIGWHCWSSNTGSWRTAQRIGFRKVRAYASYLVFFNAGVHHAVRGDIALNQGEYDFARAALEQAFATGDAPAWALLSAAGAAARQSDYASAMRYLHTALENGLCSRGWLEQNAHLQGLHDHPEWQAMVNRLGTEEANNSTNV